jgi:UDP-2,4-diacetamido-2,4,6-trideoxy-beta-L-altropyranose hydrolase
MTSRVAFRVAAAPGLGLGHATRCRSLAEGFDAPLFITNPSGVEVLAHMDIPRTRILALGDGVTTADGLAAHPEIAAVVVDTLSAGNAAATTADVAALVATGRHVTVIDSMPPDHFRDPVAPAHVPDLLVTPYLRAEELRPAPRARHWLAGARYAILPSAYGEARLQPFPDEPRILVACGGADPSGLSARIASFLAEGHAPVDIVVGPQFAPTLIEALERLAADHPCLHLYAGLRDLMPLYLTATVVLGRPGLLRYEAAALGRNGIYLSESEAYMAYFKAFQDSGLAEVHLATLPGSAARFDARVMELTDLSMLRQVSCRNAAAASAVDGGGAARIAEAITSGLVTRKGRRRT